MLSRTARRFSSSASSQPWLFVGLGNPGDKFQGTRHNVGFDMIDAFSKALGISMDELHCKALFGQGLIGDVPVFLAKPQTYMNLSGDSAGPLAAYYKLPLNRVVVFHDDMNLPCGVLRLCDKGGHGGHKGFVNVGLLSTLYLDMSFSESVDCLPKILYRLKSVIYNFRGNREFARLRIGIGRPPGQMDPKAFLLQKFNATARERINVTLQEGIGALKLLVSKGLTESARCFNREQKFKHIRVQTLEM